MRVLFFSRGLGRGHAVPDMAIADELLGLLPGLTIRFVSYASGADTLRTEGREVIDLNLPEDPPLLEVLIRATRLAGEARPDLAVIHEEFMAAPACRIFRVPSIFLTEWFADPTTITMHCIHYADRVVALNQPGQFDEPPYLAGRVDYTGPVIRKLRYSLSDRTRARRELGIGETERVILVMPGSLPEQKAPITGLAGDCVSLLGKGWRLLWVAGADRSMVEDRLRGRANIDVLGYQSIPERLMVASDVVLTRANRITVFEAAALGVPTLSLSARANPFDDRLIEPIPSNRTLTLAETSAEQLARVIEQIVDPGAKPLPGGIALDGAAKTAAAIARFIGSG